MVEISDLSLLKVAIYNAFVNYGHIHSPKPIWKNPWVIGGATALTGVLLAPFAVTIVGALGFGSGSIAAGSFAAWFMSLYGRNASSGNVWAILQSIGAVGLSKTGVITAGTTSVAIGGGLGKFFGDRTLSESEEKTFESFIKIELVEDCYSENYETIVKNSKVILHLYKRVLENEKIVETFLQVILIVTHFTKSKYFDFMVDNQDIGVESLKGCIYLLQKLIQTYNGTRVSVLSENKVAGNVRGYSLDLSDYEVPSDLLPIIEEWKRNCQENNDNSEVNS
ncbi:hypothetical protein Glove_390g16 [Diversispora epigaea]|uniref:Uncharacterized protein n=1 Tax=Diversispora epigaea TaxID=1348612 RepID=A0A397H5Y3_9GLOM|nr:hypothetical protein Glove_390g16 [Diversispora epigaea]